MKSILNILGRTDAGAKSPVFWPLDVKNWLIWKAPNSGKDWRQEEKGMTEDEMIGWHYQFDGHEFAAVHGFQRVPQDWATELNWITFSEILFQKPMQCRKQNEWLHSPGSVLWKQDKIWFKLSQHICLSWHFGITIKNKQANKQIKKCTSHCAELLLLRGCVKAEIMEAKHTSHPNNKPVLP